MPTYVCHLIQLLVLVITLSVMDPVQHGNISKSYPLLYTCSVGYSGGMTMIEIKLRHGIRVTKLITNAHWIKRGGTSCAEEFPILDGYEHTTTFLIDTGGAAGCGCLHRLCLGWDQWSGIISCCRIRCAWQTIQESGIVTIISTLLPVWPAFRVLPDPAHFVRACAPDTTMLALRIGGLDPLGIMIEVRSRLQLEVHPWPKLDNATILSDIMNCVVFFLKCHFRLPNHVA